MTSTTAAKSATKVITGLVRFSYLHVFHPVRVGDNPDEKYSAALIIPKSDKTTLKAMADAIEEAKLVGKVDYWGGKIPANLKLPLHDGNERPDDPAYRDCFFINANAKNKPQIVDRKGDEIYAEKDVYSGCYGVASITFYPYSVSGSKGIAVGLNNIMKVKDGEPLSSRSSAKDDFANIKFEDDDDDDILGS